MQEVIIAKDKELEITTLTLKSNRTSKINFFMEFS